MKTIGSYEIVSSLGVGGMGEVFRARDPRLQRDVAIKLISSEVTQNRDLIARFHREAKILASVNHANIAAVYGFEESEGRPFRVRELVEGMGGTVVLLPREGAAFEITLGGPDA